jgi:ATP-dependent protease ClpP protease subunit
MTRLLVDRGLVDQVWRHLHARDEHPRPKVEGRPRLKVAAQADEATDMLIYDEISWWGICAQDVVDALDGVTGDLNVRINSPGGDVFDGFAIYNLLAGWDGKVTVVVDGLAASAASCIAMAGDQVTMQRASQMMIHDASGLCIGNAAEMTEMAALLNRVSDTIAGTYADKAGGDVAEWRAAMRTETWYSASEAVAAKLADVMAPSRHNQTGEPDEPGRKPDEPDESMAATASFDLTCFQYAGREHAPAPVILGTAVGPHEGTAKEGTWDAGAEQGKLASPMPVTTARKMYALYDGDKVEDGKITKGACSLPHHFVSEDGTPGAPSLNGVNNALARLSSTKGYSEEEKATAERHLNGHKPASSEDNTDKPADNQAADGVSDWWADTVATLTQPPADGDWSALVAPLINPASSSAATEA